MKLDQRITDYATLVALMLVLLTLFTSQRAIRLTELSRTSATKPREAWQEILLDGSIALVTVILFATGLPLAIDAVKTLHPLGESGPLRGGFAITWLLLIVLVLWQAILFFGAISVLKDAEGRKPTPRLDGG